jgi:hypothetical protein
MLIILYLFSSYIVKQAGTLAIRARRKVTSERDFLDAVEKVVRHGTKFSSTYIFHSSMILLMIYFDSGPCTKCTTSSVPFPLHIIYLAHTLPSLGNLRKSTESVLIVIYSDIWS